jgi:hypothetical protein
VAEEAEVRSSANFTCLAATAEPDDDAQAVTAMVDDLVRCDRDGCQREPGSLPNAAQKKAG